MDDDVISIASSGEGEEDRRAILDPVVRRVVDALGGFEDGVYRMGDEAVGCLRDLKKLWRLDDSDDERTVARIFWETRVFSNDLVPILLATAGKGLVEDKRAIACADLMTAMTWPIDMAEELKELDDARDKGTDYTELTFSHLNYKAALLKPGVMQALFGIILPPLSKPVKERSERDGQLVNVILHLVRNLAFIKDLPVNLHLSGDQAEYSSLQTKLIKAYSETNMLDLLLTIASNSDNDPLFNSFNTLVLEIFYLLFRGLKPSTLAINQTKQPTQDLRRLLAAEDRRKRDAARYASSRHSQFGTTLTVQLNPKRKTQDAQDTHEESQGPAPTRPLVLHRQAAISKESGDVLDIAKQHKWKKTNKVDELTREDNLSTEARMVLQGFAREFVESCFNPFLASLLRDIKSERPKITEKDHLRLLYTTKWLLEFFLVSRSRENAVDGPRKWSLGLVAEVTDRSWIVWVLRRMRGAMDEKPKMWTELQAGIECLTQLLLLIDTMSSSVISDSNLDEAARLLQQQLIYNGDVLDIALDSLRSFKEGTQSLAYLNASVYLSYALLRMLEKWGKRNSGAMYVRKKKASKKKKGKVHGITENDGVPDVEEEVVDEDSAEEVIHETMFTFEAFEMKFAHPDVTRTLLAYLSRYKEFDSPELMTRVVNLMHRQAVKVKAEGLYFNVSTLQLFKTILDDERSLPKETPYKDLVRLLTFILRRFFKALDEEPFLAMEALYPMNRGHWKQYSSWEPERTSGRIREATEENRNSTEVQVKKGYSWSEQIGIAVAALIEDGKTELVEWVKDILVLVICHRQRVVEETDQKDRDDDENAEDAPWQSIGPSKEASSKFTDYVIPYINDEHADAATKNPTLKLMFRLLGFTIEAEDAEELQWVVPAKIVPSALQSAHDVVDQYLRNPIDLEGKKAGELITKKARRRRRRRSVTPNTDVELPDDEPKRRKAKKKREEKTYKSAQFIEDSDEECGDMEAFLEREKALRERTAKAAEESGQIATMRATGTKKRRKKAKDDSGSKRARTKSPGPGGDYSGQLAVNVDSDDSGTASDDDPILRSLRSSRSPTPPPQSIPAPAPKPRPKPRLVQKKSSERRPIRISSDSDQEPLLQQPPAASRSQPKRRLVLSDDEM
ncbi:timeless protein-domain-containing protein [Pisolithus albus]|nr:timeless protein-domain-containing protein [Pisolithus albus]